ncbi:MAG: glycosyltransferase family 4 protein [Patescibacteria group bacterium]|jgi:glycosyltransferase involved in cell wall biosynthesis
MQLKAAIYDPYLDTLGGGERYCLTVAEILLKNHYSVDLFWSGDPSLIKKAEKRFSLKLKGLNTEPDIFQIKPQRIDFIEDNQTLIKVPKTPSSHEKFVKKFENLIKKYLITKNYDVFFFLSDGSVPLIFSKNNLLHVQVPFNYDQEPEQHIFNTLKLKLFKNIICNSQFTQKFTQKLYGKHPSVVLYPPVDIEKFSPKKNKENIILSVGRFDNILNAKKQDILIDAFKSLFPKIKSPKWKLVLAGGSLSDPENNAYLKLLQNKADNYPIEFYINPDFETLSSIYSASKIYWHAAGFGVDENKEPQYTEHFGITIVEAMSSGLVPVVVKKGGLIEIVNDGKNGYLWDTKKQLVNKTLKLINNPKMLKLMFETGLKDTKQYSKESFEKKFLSLINER